MYNFIVILLFLMSIFIIIKTLIMFNCFANKNLKFKNKEAIWRDFKKKNNYVLVEKICEMNEKGIVNKYEYIWHANNSKITIRNRFSR